MTNEQTAPKAGRREWIRLAVIALPCLLYSMDLTVLHLAIPSLSADLQPTSAQLLWIIDIYGFLLAGALIPIGGMGDRIGRRKLLLIGAAAFAGRPRRPPFRPARRCSSPRGRCSAWPGRSWCIHPIAHLHRVRRRGGADESHRRLGRKLRGLGRPSGH